MIGVNVSFMQFAIYPGGAWVRLFRHGIAFNDRTRNPAPFSIRQGLRRELRIGRWGVAYLPPVHWPRFRKRKHTYVSTPTLR
jgi:hypothetical protein